MDKKKKEILERAWPPILGAYIFILVFALIATDCITVNKKNSLLFLGTVALAELAFCVTYIINPKIWYPKKI